MIYQWKDKSRMGGDAQAIGDRIEAIRGREGSYFTPDLLVDDGRDPESPLHPCFEWDDAKAADGYRIVQARQVVRSLVVTMEGEKEQPVAVRAFVSVTDDENEGPQYTSIGHAMEEPDLRRQVIAQAQREFEAWRNKYKDYRELASVFSAYEQLQLTA